MKESTLVLDKDEMRKQYGVEKVELWRRSFDIGLGG